MANIGAILFDVGGVLLTNGWDYAERARVLAHFGLDPDSYDQRHEEANDAWEKGLITTEEFLRRTVFFEPRPFTPAEFLERMKAQSRELNQGAGAMPTLKRLRASGAMKLATLNNEARELNEFRIERFELRRYFDVFLSSCYLGLRKPDPRIFQLALDVLQRRPEEVAFVDDRQPNCDVAQSLGIHGICYRNETQLVEQLVRLGVS